MKDGSLFSIPSPALIVCRFFDDSNSNWCEVISHCSFDLHFSMMRDVEHVFMCLLDICMSSFFFPRWCNGEASACSAGDLGDVGLSPVLGRSPEEGNGNPLQYSCLENSVNRGAWQAAVNGITESRTLLSMSTHTHTSFFGEMSV